MEPHPHGAARSGKVARPGEAASTPSRRAMRVLSAAAPFAALLAAAAVATAAAAAPEPAPVEREPCRAGRLAVAGLSIEARDCRYATGHWQVRVEPELPGLALWRDGDRVATVLQVFRKRPADAVSAILPELRARGYIPPDHECVFRPGAPRAGLRRDALYEIRPEGARRLRFEATPADEVPDPPCGEYGWSTHGVRYFLADPARPDAVVYVNEGQDGTQIDPASLRWD